MLTRLTALRSVVLQTTAELRLREAAAAQTLPPHTLMQRAGRSLARLVQVRFPHARRIVVLAGPGNNGGDALVAAARLPAAGRDVRVLAYGADTLDDWSARLPADAAWSLQQLRQGPTPLHLLPPDTPLPAADLYIDALLGIGLRGPVRPAIAAVIERLDHQPGTPVLSVDLPSGLDADTGVAPGPCVRATVTLSLLGLKPGLCTGPAVSRCGEVWCDDLDLADADQNAAAPQWLGADQVRPLLPDLAHAAHKGQRGDVWVLGGAPGMVGAALLAARAAARLGAGRVFASLIDPAAPRVDSVAPELMLRAADAPLHDLSTRSCVVAGPGGGLAQDFRSRLEQALSVPVPLVLDADALNLLADASGAPLRNLLDQRTQPTVLTPHPLEAARLLGTTAQAVQADRLQAARTLAQRHAAWVVLKGAGSVIASPQQALWLNSSGNGLLATAGSGDTLAGSIAALIAATGDVRAVLAAVWLHGCAASRYARQGAASGLTAADLPTWMAQCWAECAGQSGDV